MRTVRVDRGRVRPIDAHVTELRKMRIGPIFPAPEDGGRLQGMRGVPRRATKRPFIYNAKRRVRAVQIVVECRLCPFVARGNTWRPTRRVVADHVAKKHGKAGVT